jgi:hypothetical protein
MGLVCQSLRHVAIDLPADLRAEIAVNTAKYSYNYDYFLDSKYLLMWKRTDSFLGRVLYNANTNMHGSVRVICCRSIS